jgi:hypothetical protein
MTILDLLFSDWLRGYAVTLTAGPSNYAEQHSTERQNASVTDRLVEVMLPPLGMDTIFIPHQGHFIYKRMWTPFQMSESGYFSNACC